MWSCLTNTATTVQGPSFLPLGNRVLAGPCNCIHLSVSPESPALQRFLSGTLEALSSPSPICIFPSSNSAGEGLDDFQSHLKLRGPSTQQPLIYALQQQGLLPTNSKQEGFSISQTQTSWVLDATSRCW